jgi:hypothetical protein
VIGKDLGIDLLYSDFPKFIKGKSDLNMINDLMEFNGLIWKAKKDKSLSLKDEISGIELPKSLKAFEKDIVRTHNLK